MSAIYEGGCAPGVTGADIMGRPPEDHTVGAVAGPGACSASRCAP